VTSRIPFLALALILATAPAHADQKAAAEHFALAESAERRRDWRAAIDEYERAYEASPHPSVLYNIGANYQRLGEHRAAATYFRRYLDESGAPSDRAEVEARIETLRARPSQVEIKVNPPGAQVFVDGADRGAGPITVELDAGRHSIYAAHAGRTSDVRELVLEYGDPITVTIDLDAYPGILVVRADINGAEVRVDGDLVGHTPFSGLVTSGKHKVSVVKAGYGIVERDVDIPPRGSQQVRVQLPRLDTGEADAPVSEPARYVLDIGYGLDTANSGLRYLLGFSYRASGGRWDVGAMLGKLHNESGGAFGFQGRLFIATARLRPYLRTAYLAYRPGVSDSATSRLEGGAGLLVSGQEMPGKTMALEYFIELDAHVRLGSSDLMDDPAAGVAIVGGLGFRFGAAAE
jgi:hypothetical protein